MDTPRKGFGGARRLPTMVVADLHVHTRNSDGTLTLEAVPATARAAGVEAVAITDHERLHPQLPDPVTSRGDVTVIHGIELRVATSDERVDLLGYGVTPTSRLRELIDRIQADRVERAHRMIQCVEARLGVDLPVAPRPGLGRPHIARAVSDAADLSYQAVFDNLIGEGCPCYVARDVPTLATGRAVLADACGLVGLAHPFRYENVPAALEIAATLDAIEVYYPYERDHDPTPLEQAASVHNLVVTGGSDAHDDRLGRAGLDRSDYRQFHSALGLA